MRDALKLMTCEQAARRLSVRRSMILRLIRRRDLAAVKVGRHWRIEPQAIEAYITAHRTAASVLEDAPPVDDRQLVLFTPPPEVLTAEDALRLTLDELATFRRSFVAEAVCPTCGEAHSPLQCEAEP